MAAGPYALCGMGILVYCASEESNGQAPGSHSMDCRDVFLLLACWAMAGSASILGRHVMLQAQA